MLQKLQFPFATKVVQITSMGKNSSKNVYDAIEQENWTDIRSILSKNSRHVADSVVTQLISEDNWSDVRQVVRCVGDEERTWIIEGVSVKNNILLSVADRDWTFLQKGSKDAPCGSFSHSTIGWIIQQALSKASECELVNVVLPHCPAVRRDSVLKTLVERRLWEAVLYVQRRGVSDFSKRWVVLEVCACCESGFQGQIVSAILLPCADDQVECVLTTLVERRQWLTVVRLLKKGVSDSIQQWSVREVCIHCAADDEIHRWLSELKRDEVYDRDFCSDSPVEQFLVQNILPHCADDQLDSVLTTLVKRSLWQAVLHVLKRGVSDSSKRWVVWEMCACCESAAQEQISEILLFCADDQADCVLTTLVERRQWLTVVRLLKKGVSDSIQQWAVREVCIHCEADDEIHRWFSELERDEVYDRDSPVEQFLVQNILPHCADDQLDSVLKTLVERRLWQAVLFVLKRGVSDSSKRWVVLEMCGCQESVVPEKELCDMLHLCADDQMEHVLTTLVERHQWRAVGKMLKKGVSDSNKQWAVREACEHCDMKYRMNFDFLIRSDRKYHWAMERLLVKDILPHCADDQLDSVLTTLVKRRIWQAVLYVLKRGVSDISKRWVVKEVCTCCESVVQEKALSEILHFCSGDHVDSVPKTLVEQFQLRAVGDKLKLVVELLKQGVSETLGMWALAEARKVAKNDDFVKYVLPHCSLSHLNSVMPDLVKQGEQTAVDLVMRRHRKDMNTASFVLPRWYVDVLPMFVELSRWDYVQEILHSVVKNSLCHLVTRGGEIKEDYSVLLAMVNTCRVNALYAVQLFKAAKKKTASKVRELHECLGWTEDLCEVLYTSFLDLVCVALCSEEKKTDVMTDSIHSLLLDIYIEISSCIQTISPNSVEGTVGHFKGEVRTMTPSAQLGSSSVRLLNPLLKQYSSYYISRKGNADNGVLMMMFAVLPVVPELQNVALRIMLRHKRWDVIRQADLSGVWEQDRRHLLQAAVKQRRWSVVKRWADHTLYDDQRVWALNEALNEKQWDVALLLADHGLTDIDLMRVHYRLAKYADWDVILHMFERGADVAEVRERLGRMKDNKRISEKSQLFINERHSLVKTLEKTIQNTTVDDWENACRGYTWIFVLFTLIRNPSKEFVSLALKVATKKKAWHVVIQLVRLGMDAKQRHSLFSQMMKRRQWGVCRVLLEQGLSVQLCLKVLPKLMEMNQWALVARVMEHDVGDDVRQQVMQRAWERREGSVVWLCIKSLPTPLSVEEREVLFQRAFSCEMWQVLKPLVEEKDETGIRHRDTALLEAIEQHQWDLVDHCQRHHADINMKDDDGHTPLQRAAMKKDWEAVEELVVRDGDPNLLDKEGYTVLHRVIKAHQWGTVDLLIQYHADIHKEDKSSCGAKGVTPLSMLIDARQGNIIERTLLWCPDQSMGRNGVGETTLHVSCLSGCYDSMYYLVARGVNPLAVTKTGQSALVYAVLNKGCPQRILAECIRLGFSTHQPKLTNIEADEKCLSPFYHHGRIIWHSIDRTTSPFLHALLRGLPVVMQMLYESGACSQRELFRLYTQLLKLTDQNTMEGTKLLRRSADDVDAYNKFVHCIENITLPYLTKIATTPRSLVSTCRLVISHCLTLSKTRHRDVDQLPLTERMKNFILFSDVTDPDLGKDIT